MLGTMTNIVCSTPPESVVENMGGIIEHIKTVREGFQSSTNKTDVKDIV